MFSALRFGLLASFVLALGCSPEPNGTAGGARPSTEKRGAAQEPATRTALKATGQLGPGGGLLIIDIEPAAGNELSVGAPLRLSAQGTDLSFPEAIHTELSLGSLPLRLPIVVSDGATGPAELNLTYYTCSHGADATCRPERVRLLVDLDLSGATEGGEAHLTHRAGS